jgi:hypothetical protein
MRTTRQQKVSIIGIFLLAGALAAPGLPTAATDTATDTGWRVRFYAASIDFDHNTSGYQRAVHMGSDIDVGVGLGFNAEYRFSRRFGLDLGILGCVVNGVRWTRIESPEWVWAVYDALTVTPLSAGLDIHLLVDKDVDLHVRPMLVWIHYGGLVFHTGTDWTEATVRFDDDLTLGVAFGLDVPFGARDRWSFSANLAYLESELESRGWARGWLTGDLEMTILGLGLGYRF